MNVEAAKTALNDEHFTRIIGKIMSVECSKWFYAKSEAFPKSPNNVEEWGMCEGRGVNCSKRFSGLNGDR